MNTILIIAFICATKLGFMLWFGKTAWGYYEWWRDRGTLFAWPMRSLLDVAIDACIMMAGWAWVFGSGIA